MHYAVLIPCGPAPLELERLTDLLGALAFHDPVDCVVALVLNDGNTALSALPENFPNCRVLTHPRNGEGWGWGGGLIAGEIWASEWIAAEYPQAGCIVKMDTDALPLKPLGAALEALFADPAVGMAGSRIGSDPLPPYKRTNPLRYFANKVRKLRAPVSLWRKPRWHLRFALFGSHRWIASLYSQAQRSGYLPGELIEGGACVWSMALVRALGAAGVTSRWRDFLDLPVSDDVVLTMLVYFAGFRAIDSPLFCIEPASLRWAPAVLLEDPRIGIVHSLKRFGSSTEPELREAFRLARNA